MNYQEKLIKELQATYSDYSLKDFSRVLDIEKTRLFRIFNGLELKVSELWKIEELLNKSDYQEGICSLGFLDLDELKIHLKRNNRLKYLLGHEEVA